MEEQGLWNQWRQANFVIRTLAHVGAASESSHGRSPFGRSILLAASIAADTWVAGHDDRSRPRHVVETLINAIDAASWSWFVRDESVHLRTVTFAALAPSLLENGFRLGAGTAAVPMVRPPVAWRPLWRQHQPQHQPQHQNQNQRRRPDTGRVVEIGFALALDAVPVLTAMSLARRRRGLRVGAGPLGWGALAAIGGYGLARTRAGAQHSTRRTWDQRSQDLIEEARIRSRVQSALLHNNARVDPKGMLALLERTGSTRAETALDELTSMPQAAVSAASGRGITLSATVDLRSVDPRQHRTRWIPRSQVQVIRDAIAEIDAELAPLGDAAPPDDHIEVVSADSRLLTLAYRSVRIEAPQPTPDLAIRLEPTIWASAASIALTLFNTIPQRDNIPAAAIIASVVLQSTALGRLGMMPATERRGDRTTAALIAAGSVVLDAAIARSARSRDTVDNALETAPGTGATQPLMFLIGSSWDDLRAERPFLVAAAVSAWFVSLGRPFRRSWRSTLMELCFLIMPALATAGVGARTRSEAQLLDDVLQRRLALTTDNAARKEAEGEVARFLDQLDIVIDELPDTHPGLSEPEVADIIGMFTAERTRIAGADPLDLISW